GMYESRPLCFCHNAADLCRTVWPAPLRQQLPLGAGLNSQKNDPACLPRLDVARGRKLLTEIFPVLAPCKNASLALGCRRPETRGSRLGATLGLLSLSSWSPSKMSQFSFTRRALMQSAAFVAVAAALPWKAFAQQASRLVVAADSEPKNLNPAIVASNGVFFVASKVIEPLAVASFEGKDGLDRKSDV